jgi:hypothetical protein
MSKDRFSEYAFPNGQSDEWPKDLQGDEYPRNGKTHNGNGTFHQDRPKADEIEYEPILRRMADVQSLATEWLWKHWLPAGMLSVLDGDPGLAKSQFTLDLAARLSRGWLMPPQGGLSPNSAAGVLLLSAEDDLERTIRPRLDAAGADLDRVFCLEGFKEKGFQGEADKERPPVLPWDLDRITQIVTDNGIKLLAVDPFTAFLGSEFDAHKDHDVRRCMHLLHRFATRTRTTVLLIRHLNKLNGGPALYRGGGSIAILGASRAALVAGYDPEDPARRVLAMNRSSLGPKPRSLTYCLENVSPDVTRIAWGEECDLTADDILWHPQAKGRPDEELKDAKNFLRRVLSGATVLSTEVVNQAREELIAEKTLRRAKAELRVEAFQMGRQWYWKLQSSDGQKSS